ncbi:probable basic-leucine zipper transcription factor I [Procambarus clarkii]|uniref:probable basic-leucine zipper transcription factor I n=1 Tax=Procambarus clarkii TaxID=6728 RepID=UPI003742D992
MRCDIRMCTSFVTGALAATTVTLILVRVFPGTYVVLPCEPTVASRPGVVVDEYQDRLDPASRQYQDRLDPASRQYQDRLDPASRQYQDRLDPASRQYQDRLDPASRQYQDRLDPASRQYQDRLDPASRQYQDRLDPASRQYQDVPALHFELGSPRHREPGPQHSYPRTKPSELGKSHDAGPWQMEVGPVDLSHSERKSRFSTLPDGLQQQLQQLLLREQERRGTPGTKQLNPQQHQNMHQEHNIQQQQKIIAEFTKNWQPQEKTIQDLNHPKKIQQQIHQQQQLQILQVQK